MQDTISRISSLVDERNASADAERKHRELLDATESGRQTLLQAIQTLIRYLNAHTAKAEVVNFPDSVKTPDTDKVVAALGAVQDTLASKKDTDLSEVTALLKEVVVQAKAIPKQQADISIPETVTIRNQADYTANFKDLEKAVKAIKLVAEAPKVTVPEPRVTVTPADLSPLSDDMQQVIKAVKGIRIPEPKPDTPPPALITEPFDEYKVIYDSWHEDDPEATVEAIEYYQDGQKVATIHYKYDATGRLESARRA